MSEIEDNKEVISENTEKALCSCLYKTIIEENSECMLLLEIEETDLFVKHIEKFYCGDLDIVKRLEDLINDEEEIWDSYDKLLILTNEEITYIDPLNRHLTYFRVCRIIFSEFEVLDLNELRDLIGIFVYSNGDNDLDYSQFLIYWLNPDKEKPIMKLLGVKDCPPSTNDIIHLIKQDNSHIIEKEFVLLRETIFEGIKQPCLRTDNPNHLLRKIYDCNKYLKS